MKICLVPRLSVVGVLLIFLGHDCHWVLGQACDRSGKCDKHERCPVWADEGECTESVSYMIEHCPGSCAAIRGSGQTKKKKQPPKQEKVCEDKLERCSVWANLGECETNSGKMREFCRMSCGLCDGGLATCKDSHSKCQVWAEAGECEKNPTYMHEHCAKSCKTCPLKETSGDRELLQTEESEESLLAKTKVFGNLQQAEGSEKPKVLQRIQTSIAYMKSDAFNALPEKVRKGCLNTHELCTFWAAIGECEKNKAYMTTSCGPACMSCDKIDFAARCPPLPEGIVPALAPGDLDAMFTRIVSTAPGNQTDSTPIPDMPPYTVTVHSSPEDNGRPWVITFDNFLTRAEAEALIQHGYEEGYKRSEDVGAKKLDGSYDSVQSEGRTSENAWCSEFKGCRNKEIPQRIHNRIAAVTGIPPENSEDFQLLKYEYKQFYNTHHDFIGHQVDRNCGPRILTFFLYLSDVEEGGGTDFPDLGITVEPKLGRALLWPSVLNDKPSSKDTRMRHQALPVEKGVKFAANAWIHLYDYITPQKNGCN